MKLDFFTYRAKSHKEIFRAESTEKKSKLPPFLFALCAKYFPVTTCGYLLFPVHFLIQKIEHVFIRHWFRFGFFSKYHCFFIGDGICIPYRKIFSIWISCLCKICKIR